MEKNKFIKNSFLPIKEYKNAELQRLEILLENKNKSGVYRWTNLKNNKSYIGSAKNLSKRLNTYFSLSYLKRCDYKSKIYSALLKYGHLNFKLEILEYCDNVSILNKNYLSDWEEKEQFYINLLKPEYNICKTVRTTLGKKHKESTKIKISNSNLGKKRSEETKKLLRESKVGYNLGKRHTEEFKNKLKGRMPWNFGLKYTDDLKNKLKGRIPWNLNIKYTEEFKKRFKNCYSDEALSKGLATRLGLNANQRRFIEIKNINTGEINKFLFAYKANMFLNCSSWTFYKYIKKNTIYKKIYQLSYKIETLPHLTNIKSEIKSGYIRWVIVKNINTGEINKFKTISKASIFLNCSRSTLYRYINNKIIFKEKYQISLEN